MVVCEEERREAVDEKALADLKHEHGPASLPQQWSELPLQLLEQFVSLVRVFDPAKADEERSSALLG